MSTSPTFTTDAINTTALHITPNPTGIGIFIITMLLVTNILIIAGNVIVLLVFHYTRSLRNVTSVFIKSLAFADLGVGINCLFSIQSWFAGGWPYGMSLCRLIGYFLAVMVGVSLMSLAGVSIDRYIAIIKPLRYQSILTKRRARISIIAMWVSAGLIFLPSLFGWGSDYYYYNSETYDCTMHWEENVAFSFYLISIVVLPALAISAFCYFWILRACVIQERKIRQYERVFQQPNAEASKRRNERILAKMFLLIISAFYLTWIPFVVVRIIKGASDVEISPTVMFFTGWLGITNSFLNCFIYSICHRPFRKGCASLVKKTWLKCKDPCKRGASRRRGGGEQNQQWIRTQQTMGEEEENAV